MVRPIEIDGKKYISTKDAAALCGYTSDYVGQLARAGKIDSRLHGHTRFVGRTSVLDYSRQNGNGNGGRKRAQPTKAPVRSFYAEPLATSGVRILSHSPAVVMSGASLRNNLLRRESVNKIAAMFVALLLVFTTYTAYNARDSITGEFNSIAEIVNEIDATELVGSIAELSFFERVAQWAQDLLSNFTFFVRLDGDADVTPSGGAEVLPSGDPQALVVVPSTGANASDDKLVEDVRESFSDQVRVVPDDDGISGIVQPVFRDTVGDSFIYVLVPLEE